MTRFRAAAVAVGSLLLAGSLLAGCKSDDAAPAADGAGANPASAPTTAGGGGGDRWCDAMNAFLTSQASLFTKTNSAYIGEKVDAAAFSAETEKARGQLNDLDAATPAELRADEKAVRDYFASMLDTFEQVVKGDRSKYQTLTAMPTNLKEPLGRVSEYTKKQCPGFTNPILGGTS